jgi:hypothetical protein
MSLDTSAVEPQQADEVRKTLESLPDYKYSPLNPGEDTRVIKLLPSTNVHDDIVCEIKHISIGAGTIQPSEPYAALSYVCGPDEPSRFIRCTNGTKLSIRPYLFDAIKGQGLSNETRTFWIDQISINQQDIPEREKQVGNFGPIFSRAWQVRIWIREDDWGIVEKVFSLINYICTQQFKIEAVNTDPAFRGRVLDEIFDIPPASSPECVAVRRFLRNEWFFRTWTFQEIALAKAGVLICGPHTLELTRLELVGALLASFRETWNVQDFRFKEGAEVLGRIASTRALIHRLSNSTYAGPEPESLHSLFHVLTSLRGTRCSDPRDKIWAVISTANDVHKEPLQVDYSRSWQSVYVRISHWLHRRHQNLAFLQLVEIKNRKMKDGVDLNRPLDLPSWVPDFRSQPDMYNITYQPPVKIRTFARIYYASGDSHSTSEEDEMNSRHLLLKGIKLGCIKLLSEPAGNLLKGVGIGEKVLQGGEWPQLARLCSDKDGRYPHTAEPINRAFERLRIGDQLPDEGANGQRSRRTMPDELPQPQEYRIKPVETGSDEIFVHGDTTDIGMCILRATTRRRMFITDTGFMGLTHRSNLVRDEIWVLMGADMPVTLHPVSSPQIEDRPIPWPKRYEFRGESYVHGMMDGEALVQARKKQDTNCPADNKWLDELGFGPFPFKTEEILLV